MSDSTSLPLVMTAAGPVPTPPATLNAALITIAQGLAPGLTANLPGALIEDLSSTGTGALVIADQARVDAVNSLTPYGANAYLLVQLGAVYGVPAGQASNPSVYLVFTGDAGFVVPIGFTISDGSHQYVIQDGGILGSDGTTPPLFALASDSGSWAIPASSVTQLVTSVPPGITLTVTNPLAGAPGAAAQTEAAYRAAVLQAGLVAATGMPNYLKTLLGNVAGVQPNLVSVRQKTGGWEVIVGGSADPLQIGNAIFDSLFDISTLVGSTIAVTGITNANPGVVTTDLNHSYASGQVINIAGAVGISGVNNTPLTITVIDEKTFSIGVDTTSSGTWTSGGVVTPNFRNVSVSINSYPDVYTVPIVIPPVQTVLVHVTWDTSSLTFVSPTGVAQLAQAPLAAYINAIPVGAPINLLELSTVFIAAVSSLIPESLITVLIFGITINGIVTDPGAGTQTIFGDPESYFSTSAASVTVVKG